MYLEHGEQQMLFAALILVAVNGEHDCLEQRIDLRHGNEAAQMRDVSGLGLEQEKQVSVFLCLVVVREEPLLKFAGFIEVVCNFILLIIRLGRTERSLCRGRTRTSSKAMRF
jgi:hypothetical protein